MTFIAEMGKLRPAGHMQPTKCFLAANQKLLGSKNNFVYDIVLFVYDILIDIVLFITVSHYITLFFKCMCFSSSFYCFTLQNITSIAAYIPLCVLRNIWQHTMWP